MNPGTLFVILMHRRMASIPFAPGTLFSVWIRGHLKKRTSDSYLFLRTIISNTIEEYNMRPMKNAIIHLSY